MNFRVTLAMDGVCHLFFSIVLFCFICFVFTQLEVCKEIFFTVSSLENKLY